MVQFSERHELVKLLAKTRVVNEIRKEQDVAKDARSRDEMAIRITEETEYIKRVMNLEDIRFELSAFSLECDSLTYDEAVRALALARLKVVHSVAEEEGSDGLGAGLPDSLIAETGEVLGGIVSGMGLGFAKATKALVGGQDRAKGVMKDGFSSMKGVVSRYGMNRRKIEFCL